jgi:Flp pilus assembly protein TadD
MPGIDIASPPADDKVNQSGSAARDFIRRTYVNQATTLLRNGNFADAEYYLRETLKLLPDDADALNKLGTVVWQQGRLLEADACFQRAYELDPDDFAIVNNLATSCWEQHRCEQAAEYYRQTIAIKEDCVEAWMYLGSVLINLGDFEEAIRCLEESLRLRPDSPEAIATIGAALVQLGRDDEAMAHYDEALELRPDYPEGHRSRAFALLADGDYERGWPEYEWRFLCRRQPCHTPAGERWNGEDLSGKTILLYSEQGLGDTLQFIRYAGVVKERGARVIALCHRALVRLLACCNEIDEVFEKDGNLPHYDYSAPMMSLPGIVGTTLANVRSVVPYLSADANSIAAWQPILEEGIAGLGLGRPFRIGIAWQGSLRNYIDRWRSFPLEQIAPLAEVPGVCFVSLQKGVGLDQLQSLAGRLPLLELPGSTDGSENERDFLDTAAVASQLDLVITPDTAVSHLAGSLGLPVWLALSYVADWRWLKVREDSPWYPTMRMFRQTRAGDWEGVFQRMAEALRERLGQEGAECGAPRSSLEFSESDSD